MFPNGISYERPITTSLRQSFSLVGALILLKTLQAVTSVSLLVSRKNTPPQWTTRATNWAERCIVNIVVSIIQSVPGAIYQWQLTSPVPERYSDAATAVYLQSPVGSRTLMTVHPPPIDQRIGSQYYQGDKTDVDADEDADFDVGSRLYHLNSIAVPDNFGSEFTNPETVREEEEEEEGEETNSSLDVESHSMDIPHCAATSSALRYTELVSGRPALGSLRLSRELSSISSADRRDLSLSSTASREGALALEINALQQSKSSASYPGKFPVSDNLEYGSLTTAPPSLKGPGMRPPSEG